ncbi:viral A-type inclusion protein [Dyadobacter psychrotolerans]|uniref:Viral A-type inclusion protein n=1 Tax=Dyadobacter psychrotolerans TaxID=2541721 RepID=A0A4R5DVK4_9BACT|nr:viral A-type inclusion protein [Dyadobacter psychrotolerans]TDE16390.1 viral A-type inclusion protein [Dyadobacter psychrotolerans]
MKNYIPVLGLAAIMLACSQDKEKVLELEGKVLGVHDEIMPRMDEIMSLKMKLSKKIVQMDSLQNEGISGNNIAEERIKATDLNQKLNESDKLMMGWMNEYRGDSAKKLKPEEAIAYFEAQQKKIEEVKQITIKSINEAKSFLEN